MNVALVYQHRTADRDRAIAQGMDELAQAQLGAGWARIGHGLGTQDLEDAPADEPQTTESATTMKARG